MSNMWNLTNILLGLLILQIACYACMYTVWRYNKDKKISKIVERLENIYYQVDWIKDKVGWISANTRENNG